MTVSSGYSYAEPQSASSKRNEPIVGIGSHTVDGALFPTSGWAGVAKRGSRHSE